MIKKYPVIFLIFFLLCSCIKKGDAEAEIEKCLEKARVYYENENYMQTKENVNKAIMIAEKEYGADSGAVAELYLQTVELSDSLDSALKVIQKSESIYEKLDDEEGLAKVLYYYGYAYYQGSEDNKAIDYFEKAEEQCKNTGDTMNEVLYDTYLWWGRCESDYQEYQKSLELYNKAEQILSSLAEEKQNEASVTLFSNMAVNYYGLEQYETAIEFYTKAIDSYNGNQEDFPRIIEIYNGRGLCNLMLGNNKKALDDIMKAEDLMNDASELDTWDKAVVYIQLSILYSEEELKDYNKMLEYGLKSCQLYMEKKELSVDELEELNSLKTAFKSVYEKTPLAAEQDFEIWYQEHISTQ